MRRTGVVLSAAALVLAAAPAATGADRPPRYVAMGDSYSAGSGIQPADPDAPPECARSILNYPHVIADRVEVRLRDVTCGAARTSHYHHRQYDSVPPQLNALGPRTRLVTMTIGGNNRGVFFGAIVKCGSEGTASAGQGSPCKDKYGRSFVRTVRQKTYPALMRALRRTHREAPNARVAILGYPWILPREEGCYPQMTVAEGDVPYLRNLQRVLNLVVERAAGRTGTRFIDFSGVSEGHDACQPPGTRWIEPVLTGSNPVIVHPNALGERRMARRTIGALGLGR